MAIKSHEFTLAFADLHVNICVERAGVADHICPSSSGSAMATPAASPPLVTSDSHGWIHHLVGSLGASQLHPGGLLGNGSLEALD